MLHSSNRTNHISVLEDRPTAVPDAFREGIGLDMLLTKIRQRKRMLVRLMLAGALVGAVASIIYSVVRTPTYTASSELLISNTTLQLSGPEAVVTQILVENSVMQTAMEMVKSSNVLYRAIDKFGLDRIERILPKSLLERIFSSKSQNAENRTQAALKSLRASTSIRRLGASQVISVSAKALTAEDAADLTNELASALVQEQNETNAVVTTSAALRERIKILGPTARIISEAVPPKSKDGLRRSLALLLGIALGGLLGLAGGLAFALVDRRVRCVDQLLAVTSVECFGNLPRIAAAPRGTPLASAREFSVLRRVRAAILERSAKAPRFIGVTSCSRGEGKTTFSASWARFIAREGSRVLLVDASRRAALVKGRGGAEEPDGLHQLLRGERSLDEVIRAEVSPNLDLLPCGKTRGSLDLLWGNLLQAVKTRKGYAYEWIILDLPALSTGVDARSAGQVVDDLVLVVEWGQTSEVQIQQTLRLLGPMRDRIAGTIITKTPRDSLASVPAFQSRAARSLSVEAFFQNSPGEGLR